VTCEPLHRVPQDINPDSSTKSVLMNGESSKADKPLTPNTEKSVPESSKLLSPGGTQNSLGVGGTPSSTQASPSLGPAGVFSGSRLVESPRLPHQAPGPIDLGPPADTLLVVILTCLIQRNNHGSTHGLLSPWLIIPTSSKPDSISTGLLSQQSTPKRTKRTSKRFIRTWSLL
jgi:hypothetical protein